MNKLLFTALAFLIVLGFVCKFWDIGHPEYGYIDLLSPNVFTAELPFSVVSFGVQNALATLLVLVFFATIVLHEPIAHAFIEDTTAAPRLKMEAHVLWRTLFLIPFFSIPLLWLFLRYGIFRIDTQFDEWKWMICQLAVMIVVHDAYFYWCHRLLHTKPFLKIHGVHHKAKDPTVLTSHLFHYVETFMNYTFIVWFALGMGTLFGKVYYLPAMAFSVFTIVWNIYGHGKRNLFPAWITQSAIGKRIAWPTYHLRHHQKSSGNFVFLFTLWDDICSTRVS